MTLSCALGISRCNPQGNTVLFLYIKSFIDQACPVKMAGYWLCLFFEGLFHRPRLCQPRSQGFSLEGLGTRLRLCLLPSPFPCVCCFCSVKTFMMALILTGRASQRRTLLRGPQTTTRGPKLRPRLLLRYYPSTHH